MPSNISKTGQLKNIKKETGRLLAEESLKSRQGAGYGQTQEQFMSSIGPQVGMAVGDTQRGMAQDNLATTGVFSGQQQASARQVGDKKQQELGKQLAAYQQREFQASMARKERLDSGLLEERNQRRQDRAEGLQAAQMVADVAASGISMGLA